MIYRPHTLAISAFVLIAVSAFYPTPASAGLFSFFSTLFNNNQNSAAVSTANVQTMPVLKAALNPEVASVGGADITVVDDQALLASVGPTSDTGIDFVAPKNDQISLYVVRQGDTLSQVAEMFGVSVNTIRWANNIGRNGYITPGQTLTILPISGLQYTVKKGDTLASIAKKYKGDSKEISNFNNLDIDATLVVGTTIVIPNGDASSTSSSRSSSGAAIVYNGQVIYNPVRSTGGRAIPGYFINPVPNSIKSQQLHGYNAVDLAVPTGMPVLAAASGSIIISRGGGWNGGYGNYIVIKHGNGTETLYSHLSNNIVSVGQSVVQGQVIGYSGSTGESTGPHVHFEIRGAANFMVSDCSISQRCP